MRWATSHRICCADGRAIYAQDWPGLGRPLVLLHGLMASSDNWNDLARGSRRRCLAIDLPGFGRSDPPSGPAIDDYADVVADCVHRLDVGRCTLVGHSLGGTVAAAVAERLRNQIHSLVLCAPAGFGRHLLAELATLPGVRRLAVGSLLHIAARPRLLRPLYSTMVTNGIDPTPELTEALRREAPRIAAGVRAGIEAVAGAGRSPAAFHRRSVHYDGPVSLLWGTRDVVVPPSHIDGVLRALPQARVHVWAGMGHHPQIERPSDLAALVEAAAQDRGQVRRQAASGSKQMAATSLAA